MKKLFKRTLATIMVVLIVITSAPLSGFVGLDFPTTANAQEGYINPFIFRAECLSGLTNDSKAETMPKSYFDIYVYDELYSPSKEFINSVKNDSFVMGAMNLWEGFSAVGHFSETLGQTMTASDYCEVIILQMMNIALKDNEFLSMMKELAIEDAATLTNNICDVFKVGTIAEIIDDTSFDLTSAHNTKLISNAVENSFAIGKASEICGSIGDIISYSQDISQFIDKVAMYAVLTDIDDYTKGWLASMYKSSSEGTYMRLALGKLMLASQNTTGAILTSVQTTGMTLAKWVISESVDFALSAIAKANPVVAAIFAGFSISTTLCNLFFGSDDICEQFHVLEQMSYAIDLARYTTINFKNNFIANRTQNNALNLIKAFDIYFNTITNVEIDCVLKFMKTLYTGGVKGWLSSMQKSYNECVEAYEGIRSIRKNGYDKMSFYLAAAYKMKCPHFFEAYYGNKSVWTVVEGNYTYKIQNNVAILKDCVETVSGNVTIPETFFGFEVTEINSYAFYGCTGLTSMTLNQGLKTIGFYAFGNTSITDITIPKTVTSMSESLKSMSKLKKVTFQSGITKIPSSALYSCSNVTNVTIPDTVTEIGSYAFYGCTGLTSVTLPKSVTKIGGYAFYNCSNISSMTLNQGLKNIGIYAFGNTSITDITIPKTVTSMSESLKSMSKLKKVTFQSGITKIPSSALYSCSNVTNVTIPDTVTEIGSYAFYGCTSLTNTNLPSSVTEIGSYAFYGCTGLTSVTLPKSITKIGGYAFYNCSNISSMTLNQGLKTIGIYAFGNTSITDITIPKTVTSMGESLKSMSKLKKVTFQSGITKIPSRALYSCSNVTNVTIPDTVTEIGSYAFYGCSTLSNVYYGSNNTTWSKIKIGSNNTPLSTATIHYNSSIPSDTHTHNYTSKVTKASLTKNGKIENKCSCGYVKSSTAIYYPKTIKLSSSEVTYNGTVRSPSITVKDSKGNTLKKGTDYTLTTPSGRKVPGVYEYKITFKGNYSGTKKLTFKILPKAPTTISAIQTISTIKLKWSASVGATGYRVYQYSPSKGEYVQIASVKGVLSYAKSGLKAGTEYKFKVKPYTKLADGTVIWGNASSAFIAATNCKAPSIISVTSPSKAKATVKWSNVDGETGYQLYYSTSKNGTYKKVNSYSANNLAGSKTFSSSASGKTIYFKVRAYKKVGSQTIYSEWSTVKSVKLK